MPDDPLEIVIREQLTIMGVDNAYHRAAAIALAVRREEPKGHHPTCSPGDCTARSAATEAGADTPTAGGPRREAVSAEMQQVILVVVPLALLLAYVGWKLP